MPTWGEGEGIREGATDLPCPAYESRSIPCLPGPHHSAWFAIGPRTNLNQCPQSRVRFVPSSPSDFLKMSVCWDKELEKLVDDVRGKVKQKTMWAIKPEEMREIRKKIQQHMAQGPVG